MPSVFISDGTNKPQKHTCMHVNVVNNDERNIKFYVLVRGVGALSRHKNSNLAA